MTVDEFDPEFEATQELEEKTAAQKRDEEARGMLEQRQYAYRRLFGGGLAGDAQLVLNDIKRFCRGGTTPFDLDPRVHALLCGRHEVWMRIMDHLNLTIDELVEKYDTRKDNDDAS